MSDKSNILCIGEVLWDSLPSGLYLGGAPLNVCYHLNQLNIESVIASKVGKDRLGKEAVRRIKMMDISTDLVQFDEQHETGFVGVEFTEGGDPQYNILQPVAWDEIILSDKLGDTAEQSLGLVFGTLAQRNETSRKTIQSLMERGLTLIFDMNLRKPFINKKVIRQSLEMADIVKMNEDELNHLIEWYSLSGGPKSAVEDIVAHFNCSTVCVTKGANGSMLFKDDKWFEHQGFPVKAKDVVGAGDAFLASLIHGIITGVDGKDLLIYANATGSLIAQKDGATPQYSLDEIRSEMV
ncbi:carbohydrate kinase family protein [Fodinibius sp. SL11]|uniref:carbohydrate kinase family protein n=1 Tax=Fodinibius sp. SL11 TaxID=3425690 RepID=UPI003F8838F3